MLGPTRGRLLGLFSAALAAAVLACTSAASADPVGIAESFPTKCGVEDLAVGHEGDVWFTCLIETHNGYGSRVQFGRVTPAGQVSEFDGGFAKNLEAGKLVVAANGDLWFPLNSFFRVSHGQRRAPEIVRVTPGGEAKAFPLGLDARYYVGDIVASPSGYLWFASFREEGKDPALWQISPAGEISKLPVEVGPKAYLDLEAGPEGDLWFARKPVSGGAPGAIVRLAPGGTPSEFGTTLPGFWPSTPVFGPDGSGWFFEGEHQTGAGRVSAAGEIIETGAKLETGSGIVGSSTIGQGGDLWLAFQSERVGSSAIVRVSPSGQVSQFRDCLRYGQPFFGPATLVSGANGDIWFTSIASRQLPGISDPPSIGRVTPSGAITQIYAGVNAEARWIVPAPDGSVWFSAGADEVQRIRPIDGPINTFHVAPLRRAAANGTATARVVLPGPGTVELKPLALLKRHHRRVALKGGAITATSTACGLTGLRVKPVGAALRAFRKRREAIEEVAVTFTPSGGTPYTETVKLDFYAA